MRGLQAVNQPKTLLRAGSPISRRGLLQGAAGLGTFAAAGALAGCAPSLGGGGAGGSGGSGSGGVVNVLAWSGHSDSELLDPFQKETGITVRVKEYTDASQMVALATTSAPGTYDVIHVDPEYIGQLRAANALEPMNPDDFPEAEENFLDEFKPSNHFPVHWYDDQMYALAWGFDYIALAYNTDVYSASDVSTYEIMMSDSARGKVGALDWWSNPLGPISMWAGNKDPFNVTAEEFAGLEDALRRLRPQMSGFYTVANTIQNLGTGQINLVPGGGRQFTIGLIQEGKPVSSVVPKEGAVQTTESLTIAAGAKNLDGAKEFIRYCISPEGNARKSLLKAYQNAPVNEKTWELIQNTEPEWADLLGLNDGPDGVLAPMREGRTALRRLPENQTPEEWQDLWTRFKDM